jgi:hypothetical protein
MRMALKMSKISPMEPERVESTDIITRYFLRRLAISRRKLNSASPNARYRDALVEVILVVVAMPAIAVLNFLGVASMTWWDPIVRARWPWLSVRIVAFSVGALALLVGHFWLGARFKQFRNDPFRCFAFATEKDRRIAYWQKICVITLCGLVAPWLGYMVNLLVK